MKKEPKDKKPASTKWIGKTATMAAVVAALGISLGVNVQKVYAKDGEDGVNINAVQDKHKELSGSQQGKITTQQHKIDSQQMKYKSQFLKIDATQHKNMDSQQTTK